MYLVCLLNKRGESKYGGELIRKMSVIRKILNIFLGKLFFIFKNCKKMDLKYYFNSLRF